jgi:thiamine biosynthesis protein ThiS
VTLTINGERRESRARTLDELIRELELDGKPVAVERNRDVVPKSKYRDTRLSDGDVLEIVHLVGGG